MKKFFAFVLTLCMMLSFAACGAEPSLEELSPEELLASNMQSYNDFMADWNRQEVIAVNARVEVDANGNRVLMADVENRSGEEVSNIVLSFAVWDAEGNFMIIRTQKNPGNTYPEFQMDVPGVTLAGGETWTADSGLFLADDFPEVAYVKAAVTSYTAGAAEHTNRLYDAWKESFLNQHLEDWMK